MLKSITLNEYRVSKGLKVTLKAFFREGKSQKRMLEPLSARRTPNHVYVALATNRSSVITAVRVVIVRGVSHWGKTRYVSLGVHRRVTRALLLSWKNTYKSPVVGCVSNEENTTALGSTPMAERFTGKSFNLRIW